MSIYLTTFLSGLKHLHNALIYEAYSSLVVSASVHLSLFIVKCVCVFPPISGVALTASVVWPNSFVRSTLRAQGDCANVAPAALQR